MGAYETDATRTSNEPSIEPRNSALSFTEPFPNPISIRAELQFSLPATEHVEITVYDVLGRLQAKLFDEVAAEGREYVVEINASDFGSGVYFARLRSASFDKVSQFVVVQ